MKRVTYSRCNWRLDNPLHPQNTPETDLCNWIFFIDLMNFSFWSDNPEIPFTVKYEENLYTGYWALCAAIKRGETSMYNHTQLKYSLNGMH